MNFSLAANRPRRPDNNGYVDHVYCASRQLWKFEVRTVNSLEGSVSSQPRADELAARRRVLPAQGLRRRARLRQGHNVWVSSVGTEHPNSTEHRFYGSVTSHEGTM